MGEEQVKIKKIPLIGTPEWMISFGDLMSCLLVFFVLLLTFSSSKPGKAMDLMGEYIGPGGNEESQDLGDTTGSAGGAKRIAVDPEEEAPMKLANLIVSQKFHEFKERLFKLGFKNDISYTQTEEGFFVETNESNVIDSKGELTPDSGLLLQAMANAALSVNKELRILDVVSLKGADEVPMSTAVKAERNALTIFEFLQNKYRMRSAKMSCGASFANIKTSKIRFLLADSLEGKAFRLSDLAKQQAK